MKDRLSQGPYIPADFDLADAYALQAMERGEADSDQQKRVIKWLVEKAAGTHQFHYYPTDRDTSFALGRAFTGQQIIKLLRLNLMALSRMENERSR